MRQGPGWATWSLIPVLVAFALIIVTDLYLRLIPNKITVPTIIYVLLLAAGSGWLALQNSVLGAAVAGAMILLLALISRGGIGGGDFKLMVVVGGALGWEAAILVFGMSQILALVAAAAVSIMQRRILRGWLPIGAIIAALAAVVLVTTPR